MDRCVPLQFAIEHNKLINHNKQLAIQLEQSQKNYDEIKLKYDELLFKYNQLSCSDDNIKLILHF